MSRRLPRAVPVLLAALIAACSDGSQALVPDVPTDTTTTTAGGPTLVARVLPRGIGPQQTYWVRVDGAQREPVSPASAATINLAPGRHVIDLAALPPWCRSVEGSRTIDVAPSQRVALDFSVACAGVIVATQTGGLVVDPDGYRVAIDGDTATTLRIASNALDTLPVSPGVHMFSLTEVAGYCSAAAPTSATIVDTAVNRVTLDVTCRGGALRIDVTTTGADPDFNGYVVTARNPVTGTSQHAVGPMGSTVIGAWPEGTTVAVQLGDVAGNCAAAVGSRSVTPGSGDTLAVAFDVTCQPFPEHGILFTRWGVDELHLFRLLPSISTLVDLGPGTDPEWSPDGRRIAYNDEGSLRLRSGDTIRIVAERGINPAFSPDGRRLYYTLSQYCPFLNPCVYSQRVYVLDLDVPGATSRVAFTAGEYLAAFDLSPDEASIAFVSCPNPTQPCNLSYARLDGTGKRTLLTRATDRPRFSPDGGTILMDRSLSTDDSSGAWLVGTDGTGARLLRNDHATGLAWSPDGSRVLLEHAYGAYDWFGDAQAGRLFTVRASDGGDEQVVLGNTTRVYSASWVR